MLPNRSNYCPTDAPASPEGTGPFNLPGPSGSQSSKSAPSRSSPVGRQGAPSQLGASSSIPKSVLFTTLSNLYIGDTKVSGFEGEIDYFYADVVGIVTIGVGHRVVAKDNPNESDVRTALKDIPMAHRTNINCIGPQHENCKYKAYCEVSEKYATWSAHSKDKTYLSSHSEQLNKSHKLRSLLANKYSQKTMPGYSDSPTNADLVLPKEAVQVLLIGDLSAKYKTGTHIFSNLAKLPFNVQLVIVDILFNGAYVGKDKGEKGGWKAFRNAIHKSDWTEAANHCAAGIDPKRDTWRRNQLRIAVTSQ